MGLERVASGLSLFKKRPRFRFKLSTHRTYILPTPFGYVFGGLAFTLLLMAIGYANNLIYIYVFMLIAVALSSMYLTNENVRQVELKGVQFSELYANETAYGSVHLLNTKARDVFDLKLSFDEKSGHDSIERLEALQEGRVRVRYRPRRRGFHQLPKLILRSSFPFGLLSAWKVYENSESYMVYPERKGRTEFPLLVFADQSRGEHGLFRDHRAYQPTDSPKRIDWRASAKTQDLMVKNYESEEVPRLEFSWDHTSFLSKFEDRISQLALWVYLAESRGHRYGLRIGKIHFPIGNGLTHYRSCMEKLSLIDEEELA